MLIRVDREVCMSHGQCEFAAPDVFRLDDDGVVHYPGAVGPALEGAVADAAAVCPTQAITVDTYDEEAQ